MKNPLLASVLAACLVATPAFSAETPLQTNYPSDSAMTCEQINAEVARMDQIVATSNQQVSGAQGTANAASLGASAAINGALYSGVLGRVPGLGLFANGAANLARQNAEAKQKAAQETIQIAKTRRALMSGLYQGKACSATATVAETSSAAASTSSTVSAAKADRK